MRISHRRLSLTCPLRRIATGTVVSLMKSTHDPALAAPDLATVIAGLPEEERAVLLLHYVRGKSTAEIAELLGVPERAVVSVLASGRAKVASVLGLPPLT